ncbi:MAG TPA: Fe-S-binding domain-containing protein, partial [Microthrixaceae bacterium]|nr:Fe-S-binding domain-containing protein [Microthrixaceae bacterium]
FAAFFLIFTMASIGLPGLNGFPGEFLSLLGAFKGGRWWGVVAVTGVILAALYLLWAYQRVFHGPASGGNATMRDMDLKEFAVFVPLIGLIVFLGLFPGPMIETMEPSVKALVAHVQESSDNARADQPDIEKADVDNAEASASEHGSGTEGSAGSGASEGSSSGSGATSGEGHG